MYKRRFGVVLTAVLVAAMMLAGTVPAVAYTVDEAFPVSLAIHGQVQPDIDYPWIVWKDGRNCENDEQGDIYAYNFATGEEMQVTTMGDPESNPSVSGDWVVYSHRDYSDTDYCSVYAQNLMTGEVKLVADGVTDEESYGNPAIDGSTVVYKCDSGYNDVFIYGLVSGVTVRITDDTNEAYEYAPEIGDGWVVYHTQYNNGVTWIYSVFAYEIATGETTEIMPSHYTSGTDYQNYYDASVDDGYVVCYSQGRWTGDSDSDYGIFLYDLAEMDTPGYEAEQIGGNVGYGRVNKPSIDDGLVSWHEDRTNDGYSWYWDVYVWDIEAETETRVLQATDLGTSSAIYGGRTATGDGIVAWHDHRDEGINTDALDYDDLYAMFLGAVPPTAGNDAYVAKQNMALSVPAAAGLLLNDTDPEDAPLTAGNYTDPAHGMVSVNADGSFLYAPDDGFVGTDTFYYKADNGTYFDAGLVTITVEQSTAITEGTGAVYRFYNPVSGSHFYTPSIEERNYVLGKYLGVWFYEGFAFTALPASGCSGIHRFYNTKSGAHFYTPCDDEKASVLAKWPTIFSYDGTSFPVSTTPGAGKIAIYRFYNTKTGAHFYTASAAEADHVIATYPGLFSYEGVGFYAVSSL